MSYNASLHTVTNKPLGIAQGVPTDARSFFYDAILFLYRPYQSLAEVNAYLNLAKYRIGNFSIYINLTGVLQSNGTFSGGTVLEYKYKDGTANSDLLPSEAPQALILAQSGIVSRLIARVEIGGNDATASINSYSKPFATMEAAYQSLPPTGGVIWLGIGDFAKPTTAPAKEFEIWGSSTPSPNWTVTKSNTGNEITITAPTKLIGGSVIKGGINFLSLNNIKLRKVGLDCGSDYVAGGGIEMNAIGIAPANDNETDNTPLPPYGLLTGIVVEDCVALCKSFDSPFHACVMERCYQPIVKNCMFIYGVHGLAAKNTGGIYENIQTYNNGSDGVIFKSNNYGYVHQSVVSNVWINNAAFGVIIQNKSFVEMQDIVFSNIFINNCTTGISTIDDFGHGFNGIIFEDLIIRNTPTPFVNGFNYSYNGFVDGLPVKNNEILFSSKFVAPENTALAAYIPDVSNSLFSAPDYGNGFQIVGYKAQNIDTTETIQSINVGSANYRMEAKVKATVDPVNIFFGVKRTDMNNGVLMMVTSIDVLFYNWIEGAYSQFGGGAIGSRGYEDNIYEIIVMGNKILFKMNGTHNIEVDVPTAQNGTLIGMSVAAAAAAAQVQFDYITVKSI